MSEWFRNRFSGKIADVELILSRGVGEVGDFLPIRAQGRFAFKLTARRSQVARRSCVRTCLQKPQIPSGFDEQLGAVLGYLPVRDEVAGVDVVPEGWSFWNVRSYRGRISAGQIEQHELRAQLEHHGI